jgi:hypothetical protein
MFGWTGLKYRTEVNVQVHAILTFFPKLKDLVKTTLPNLKQGCDVWRENKTPELEAAAYLSLLTIETVISHVPEDVRTLTGRQLSQLSNDHFRWFGDQVKNGTKAPEVLPLTFALGHAFWYLGFNVREKDCQ